MPDVSSAIAAFGLPAAVESLAPHGSGHIHQTYHVRTAAGCFLLQRLNERVFPDLDAVMENVCRIAAHLRTMTPRLTRGGRAHHRDSENHVWRVFDFIDGVESHDIAPGLPHIEAAAQAFGDYQRRLATLPGPPLRDTIPGFHDTRQRFARLRDAIARDPARRAASCAPETGQILAQAHLADALQSLHLPRRTVHNDTKLNNLLFDLHTPRPRCVIDWDTTMPGLVAHDFGDMVRTMATTAAEDEQNLDTVRIAPGRLAAITRGYLAATRDWLTPAETGSLMLGAETILFEQAVRFLTDHLEGDIYYPVARPGHNLHRARVQLVLLESLRENAGG